MNEQQYQPSAKVQAGLGAFFSKVYAFLGAGIAISAVTSYLVLNVFAEQFVNLINQNYMVFIGFWILEIALVVVMGVKAQSNPSLATAGFIMYAVLNGITLSLTLAMYVKSSITAAFAAAAITYGAMAIIGSTTKKDLSGVGQAGLSALIGIIVAILLNAFIFRSSAVDLFISFILVIIFAGLTAYDHQKIKQIYYHYGESEALTGVAVFCALQLYLDLINLFLAFLRIFGSRN